jgi:hypothetical protein
MLDEFLSNSFSNQTSRKFAIKFFITSLCAISSSLWIVSTTWMLRNMDETCNTLSLAQCSLLFGNANVMWINQVNANCQVNEMVQDFLIFNECMPADIQVIFSYHQLLTPPSTHIKIYGKLHRPLLHDP